MFCSDEHAISHNYIINCNKKSVLFLLIMYTGVLHLLNFPAVGISIQTELTAYMVRSNFAGKNHSK